MKFIKVKSVAITSQGLTDQYSTLIYVNLEAIATVTLETDNENKQYTTIHLISGRDITCTGFDLDICYGKLYHE